MDFSKYSAIIWDFNGTLLDDTSAVTDLVNEMMKNRELGTISDEQYRETVCFPVQPFYESLGFNFEKESFADLQVEFISGYMARMPNMPLMEGAKELLKRFKDEGKKQFVLSALEHTVLNGHAEHLGILEHFTDVVGSSNKLAVGKLEEGKKLFAEYNLNPKEVLMIGDTIMDSDFAKELGCDCVLQQGGHQSRSRLEATGNTVYSSLKELAQL